MINYKRNYTFRSGKSSKENKVFWIALLIGLAIAYVIVKYF